MHGCVHTDRRAPTKSSVDYVAWSTHQKDFVRTTGQGGASMTNQYPPGKEMLVNVSEFLKQTGGARLRHAILAGALIFAMGCSSLRMVPPPDIARESDVFEASNRSRAAGLLVDESFTLGPYEVAAVDRDWDSKHGSSIGLASNGMRTLALLKGDSRTAYAFRVEERGETLAAHCSSITSRKGLSLGSSTLSSKQSRLVCSCGTGETAAELVLEGSHEGPIGTLTLARGPLVVTSVRETNAAWSGREPSGFRIDQDGSPVGAVEILHPGRIWLNRTLDAVERRQIACLFAGIMLFDEPEDP